MIATPPARTKVSAATKQYSQISDARISACYNASLYSLQRIRYPSIQVGVGLVSGGFGGNPAHCLSDPPHMSVHRELMPVKAKHEHTCNSLLSNSLESFQLSLDLFICALPQMLQAAFTPFCLDCIQNHLSMRSRQQVNNKYTAYQGNVR